MMACRRRISGLMKRLFLSLSTPHMSILSVIEGNEMRYEVKNGEIDLMAVEVEARRLRANWVRTLLRGRKAR